MTHTTTLTALRNTDSPASVRPATIADRAEHIREVRPALELRIYNELAAVEEEWRRFERIADCTAFQTFDWLATWCRHIGTRENVRPVIVVGHFGAGETAFILPLGVVPDRWTRRLCWLGQQLCDYNAPLLARDFSQRLTPDRFLAVWRDVQEQLQRDPMSRYDWIEFEKMPQRIGAQINPFTFLAVTANASGVHLTRLSDDWEKFYTEKRSSATRRRDRAKRRHMSGFGAIRFVTASDPADARATLETLMEQKGRALARKGIANLFGRPGYREFYLDLVSNHQSRRLVHVSRVEIGATRAATNLGIVFGDCYYHVLASFADSDVARYGPGALHLRELMAHAIKLGLKRFDFTIGDEPYKLEWSDTNLKLYDYCETATWRGLPACWSSSAKRRVKRFIKQTPFVWRSVAHMRSAIGMLTHPHQERRLEAAPLGLPAPPAVACVMGDMDLLRPLVLAGIPCAAVSRPGVPSLYSRYLRSRLVWNDYTNIDGLLEALMAFGKEQPERPVLFFQEDGQVLFVSRHRERLAEAFRFIVADAALVEDLLDKSRFQVLAERHDLPVPAARRFNPALADTVDLDLRFPVIIKPLTRLDRWNGFWGLRKALCPASAEELRNLWPRLRALGLELLAQEFIPGAESKIESYHCYIDARGDIVGEFTGRKIRTYPLNYGHTTALEITDAEDVRRCGRTVVDKLALTGVAKLDFKRDPQGQLRLLEINPRFNLWHHPGAVAGVNLPALVYADLAGLPRPPATRAKAGVRWCRAWKDFPAARATGVPLSTWLPWMLGCETKSSLSWDDPLPLVRSTLQRVVGGRLHGEQTET